MRDHSGDFLLTFLCVGGGRLEEDCDVLWVQMGSHLLGDWRV